MTARALKVAASAPRPAVHVHPDSMLGRITALHLARFGTLPESWRLVCGGAPPSNAIVAAARHIRLTESDEWPELKRSPEKLPACVSNVPDTDRGPAR